MRTRLSIVATFFISFALLIAFSNQSTRAQTVQQNSVSESWRPVNTVNAPTARSYHTAVWTGTQMIIWGGIDQSRSYLNTGSVYSPSMDTWTPLSTTGAPSARRDHTAVWTGTEMIIWGGSGWADEGGTGARYNPAAGQWKPVSRVNAPSGRSLHTAVWTGTEMIIWGGWSDADENGNHTRLNTGARYNPQTDTWTPITLATSPLGRNGHGAVWTGSKMIIWGGTGALTNDWINSGGVYDPATAAWQPTSSVSAPQAHPVSGLVWTGSKMIVPRSSFYKGKGGIYDPSSDTWQSASAPSIPATLDDFSTVWTGKEMIFWGGAYNSSDAETHVGGRYNPETDAWIETTGVGAPSARAGHTAVWTGSEMIIWGGGRNIGTLIWGDQAQQAFNDGGRYAVSVASSSPACTNQDYSCSDWSVCAADGVQSRSCIKQSPCEGGTQPPTAQTCTQTCTAWTYSEWGACSASGQQTRTIASSAPSGCTGGSPVLSQSCTLSTSSSTPQTCTAWTYSEWGACSASGQQTRTIVSSSPSGCTGGTPLLNQSCTLTGKTCTSWEFSAWGACSVDNTQTRTITKTLPEGCSGGSPIIKQSCTYVAPCTEDKWTCEEWNVCSPEGTQSRSCKRTFDCPDVASGPPATSQYCQVPGKKNEKPTPQGEESVAEDAGIIQATVKLVCYENATTAVGAGSGTIMSPDGLIVTNKHVIEGTIGCKVGFVNGLTGAAPDYREFADIVRVASDPDLDVALLKIRGSGKTFPWIDITKGTPYTFASREKLYVYGYPSGYYRTYDEFWNSSMTVTGGHYSGSYKDRLIKTDTKIEHGNSGGGAYTRNGTYIGIPSLVFIGELESLGLILPATRINQWIASGTDAASKTASGTGAIPVSANVASIKDTRLAFFDPINAEVTIYEDSSQNKILPNSVGSEKNSNRPVFEIRNVKGAVGYAVYFGTDVNSDPTRTGANIQENHYTPPEIMKNGTYYFIFRAKNNEGTFSKPFITEYQYKASSISTPASVGEKSEQGQKQESMQPTSRSVKKITYANKNYGFELKLSPEWKGFTVRERSERYKGKQGAAFSFSVPGKGSLKKRKSVAFIVTAIPGTWMSSDDFYQDVGSELGPVGEVIGRNKKYHFTYDRTDDPGSLPKKIVSDMASGAIQKGFKTTNPQQKKRK